MLTATLSRFLHTYYFGITTQNNNINAILNLTECCTFAGWHATTISIALVTTKDAVCLSTQPEIRKANKNKYLYHYVECHLFNVYIFQIKCGACLLFERVWCLAIGVLTSGKLQAVIHVPKEN